MQAFPTILSYMGVPGLLLASCGFYLFSLNPKFSLYPIPLRGINTPQYIIYAINTSYYETLQKSTQLYYYIESWEPQKPQQLYYYYREL